MDVNGSEQGRQKRNPSIAYPLDQPAVHLSPHSLLFLSLPFPSLPATDAAAAAAAAAAFLSASSLPLPFRCLDPHRYLDGRTKAANRKPNNLGHF